MSRIQVTVTQVSCISPSVYRVCIRVEWSKSSWRQPAQPVMSVAATASVKFSAASRYSFFPVTS